MNKFLFWKKRRFKNVRALLCVICKYFFFLSLLLMFAKTIFSAR